MKKFSVAIIVSLLLPASAQAATIFGVNDTNQLVRFESTNPGTFDYTRQITGTNATFLAIDFRDSDGRLYGLANDYGLYTINTRSGLATQIGDPLALQGTNFGFDFNTVVDMIRVVSNSDENYVVNPDTGEFSQFTDVAFGSGDRNFGSDVTVSGNGYIHGTTTQFAIETNTNSLVTQANNAGTLATVGPLGTPVDPRTSFDIGLNGVAYMQNADRFFTVDLNTGAATLVGNTENPLLAISAGVAPIPEPATWGMLLIGFGAVGGVIRRKGSSRTKIAYA